MEDWQLLKAGQVWTALLTKMLSWLFTNMAGFPLSSSEYLACSPS